MISQIVSRKTTKLILSSTSIAIPRTQSPIFCNTSEKSLKFIAIPIYVFNTASNENAYLPITPFAVFQLL